MRNKLASGLTMWKKYSRMLTLKTWTFGKQLKLAAVEEKKSEQADDIAQSKQEETEHNKRLEFEKAKFEQMIALKEEERKREYKQHEKELLEKKVHIPEYVEI